MARSKGLSSLYEPLNQDRLHGQPSKDLRLRMFKKEQFNAWKHEPGLMGGTRLIQHQFEIYTV